MSLNNNQHDYKRTVGEYAVRSFVKDGMTIGLGTGTTAIWAVREIARLYKNGELKDIRCGVTGPGTDLEAARYNLPVYNLNSASMQSFDIVIDGADEYDSEYNLTKGGGGCLLYEKIVAYTSRKFICVVNNKKKVENLGISFPIPVEVIPCALSRVESSIRSSFSIQNITMRYDARNVGPWVTNEGNYILDVSFSESFDPYSMEKEIVSIVGVVECGIFSHRRLTYAPTICEIDEQENIRIYN